MPNWCENDLTVEGSRLEIDRFLVGIRTGMDEFSKTAKNGDALDIREFDFNRILPYPKKFQWSNKQTDGYNSGGYDWCVNNWGTKWNACDVVVVRVDEECVELHFNTAWAPPEPVVRKMISMFPKLEFTLEYYEQGVGYCGVLRGADGKVVEDKTKKYNGDRGG
jgi:hypothetical protein